MTEPKRIVSDLTSDQLKPDISLDQLESLFAGLVAAPNLPNVEWVDLLKPYLAEEKLTPALMELLETIKGEYSETVDYGFTDGPAPNSRVENLRSLMENEDISAFIIPRTDQFQGEYIPLHSDRLYWLTGFAGSAGLGIVGLDKAAMFVDGRYTIQVAQQVNGEIFDYLHLINDPYDQWLSENYSAGDRVAYDPWLHTENAVARLKRASEKAGFELVAVSENLVDIIWENQPAAPLSAVRPQPDAFSGEDLLSKTTRLSQKLEKNNLDAAIVAAPDCIAWLLNIRGDDVANCPLPLGFSILNASGHVDLFMDERKILEETRTHFGNHVSIHPFETFTDFLGTMSSTDNGKLRVVVDPATTATRIFQALDRNDVEIIKEPDIILIPRALKNETELNGTREAHIRDGVAVSRFLKWVDETVTPNVTTELDVVAYLENCRRLDPDYRNPSFDTISGAGPNGAVVHYRVTESTNRVIEDDSLLLVDSGGQYPFGTTDITRTMVIGTPTAEMKRNFSLVLKGHIALALARFPAGLGGNRLDTLARAPLWQYGLDYDHGTGHGVGSFLNVHEGPQRIATSGTVPLQPGMILSNEPGYYKTDAYGIRIENLIIVKEEEAAETAEGGKAIYGFETITLAPIDRNLVDSSLMSDQELSWLNDYHKKVYDSLSIRMDDVELKEWLGKATAPIEK